MQKDAESLKYSDRIWPNQHEQRKLFGGGDLEFVTALYKTVERSAGLESPRELLNLEYTSLHPIEEMASTPLNLRLLQFLIKLAGARRVLEIGAFIGVSAIYMARALPNDGSLTTVEKFDQFAKICRRNLEKNGVADRVNVIQGDAMEILDQLSTEKPFDFAIIDGDKGRYADYFRKVDKLLAPGGLVLVDDVFFHGDVFNDKPTTEKGAGVKVFLDDMAKLSGYDKITLPIGNGVFLARKR